MEGVLKMSEINLPKYYENEAGIIKRAGDFIKEFGKNVLIVGGETALKIVRIDLYRSLEENSIKYEVKKFNGYPTQKYILDLCNLVEDLGVKRVRYADTVGILSISKTKQVISELRKNSNVEIEIHSHNDFGMALAIAIESVKNGVRYVDCTLDGIGERSGNCNLQEFLRIGFEFPEEVKIDKMNLIKSDLKNII
ncbi:MAG: hypothetical protein KH069_09620 [Clostridium sp.]|nr:hypothetical protein [Clostridium sp.]